MDGVWFIWIQVWKKVLSAEEDGGYYEEDECYGDEDGGYYEDEEYYAEEDGEYYGDEDEEYYADEDDEYYEDDGYYEEEPTGFRKVIAFFTNMSAVDHITLFMGVVILLVAGTMGVVMLGNKLNADQIATFAEVGVGMEDIPVIGESGLLAIADAQLAKEIAAGMTEEELVVEEVNGKTTKKI